MNFCDFSDFFNSLIFALGSFIPVGCAQPGAIVHLVPSFPPVAAQPSAFLHLVSSFPAGGAYPTISFINTSQLTKPNRP
jgi:hypothetical protein